jgi:predicted transcriptional regulator
MKRTANAATDLAGLSRRERQIMDAMYAGGPSTAAAVRAALPVAPSYSTVRALLKILENKGHLRHTEVDGKYIYAPTRPRGSAGKSALRRVLKTFFDNSASKAVAALLDAVDADLSQDELAELTALIDQARNKEAKR